VACRYRQLDRLRLINRFEMVNLLRSDTPTRGLGAPERAELAIAFREQSHYGTDPLNRARDL